MSAAWAAPRRRWSGTGNATLKAATDGLKALRVTIETGSATNVVLPRRTQSGSPA